MLRRILKPLPEPVKAPFRACFLAGAWCIRTSRGVLGLAPPTQLVVCGYPRSGTSMLYNMLSASLDGFSFAEFEETATRGLQMAGHRASKYPLDILDLPTFGTRNPWGKRIVALVCIRDPRDILTSRHPLLPGEYFIGYDHSWWPGIIGSGQWTYSAPGIGAVFRAIDEARDLKDIDVIEVPYERLVASPDDVAEEISARTGLPFRRSFSRFHEQAERHAYRYEGRRAPVQSGPVRENEAVDTTRIGKWRSPDHRQRLVDQFSRFPELFEIVRRHGYAEDDQWFRELESLETLKNRA